MRLCAGIAGWFAVVGLAATPSASATAQVLTRSAIDRLAPGEYLWPEPGMNTGPVTVIVSLPRQRAYLFRGIALVAATTVSTGRKGYRTPVGRFVILEKAAVHRSRKYDNAPMPHMQRLTAAGVAMHGGDVPGYPASHGCIRLPPAFAERLFAVTQLGDIVIVSDDPSMPRTEPVVLPPM